MNCYVLAGGRSRRMGRSKRELFLARVMAAARQVFDDVIVLDYEEGEQGPIFGIQRALEDARDRCFVLAVDYPLITTAVLRFLKDNGGVPVWNGKPQPLCAVWSKDLLPEIEQRIAAGRFDLHGLNEQAIIAEAELRQRFEGEPLMNVNTPEEWKAAERFNGG